MGIDIGQALREGASRTAAKNGLLLAVLFAGIALLTAILWNTLFLRAVELGLELIQTASPEELGLTQQEYQEQLEATREVQSFASESMTIGVPLSVAAGGVLATALFAEAVSIIAVRIFSTETVNQVSRELVTDKILFATVNGFIGSLVVWGLIIIGLPLLVLPGIFFAVAFYFVRQEIALKNKNFIQAMADSWRITKGNRIEVLLLGFILIVVSQLEPATSAVVSVVSTPAGAVVGSLVGGLLTAFGAAVVTRAYVQIGGDTEPPGDGGSDEDDEKDPYDAALGPDDLTR
jgi:hypothetical protein